MCIIQNIINGTREIGYMSNMPKPDQVLTSNSKQQPSMMPVNITDVSLNKQSFDQLLANRGIRFIHRKAVPCVNMKSLDDNSHNPNCTICSGNGYYYYEEREVYGIFTSNSLQKNFEQQGFWEIGTAVVTVPSEYADGVQCELAMYDQLRIPDFTVRMQESQEYRPTSSNQQSMRYPINTIEFMSSVENGALVIYVNGTDFNIVDGNIEWVLGNTPGYDATRDSGSVYNIVYYSNPTYVVMNHMRELRVTQQLIGGVKTAIRLPQQVLVKRDFLKNPSDTE